MEAIIHALIQLCVLVLVVYVVLWVLGTIGISLPPQVITIIWVIVALIALLFIMQTVLPKLGVKLLTIGMLG